ncbi:MAG: AAA family ATPase [Roseburia sp.]|nr:AAA family ATPase [Roseburia sp.]
MFKRIEVDNFKSLVKFSVDLGPTCAIVGNNATGKSTILQAIDFICSSIKEDFNVMLERRGWNVTNVKSKLSTSNKMYFRSLIGLEKDGLVVNYDWELTLLAYAGKNEILLHSEKIVCEDEILLSYSSERGGYLKSGESTQRISLPEEMMAHSSVLKMFSSSMRTDKRIRDLILFLLYSSSFEMLSPNEMRLSSRGIASSIGMSGKNLPSFIKKMNEEQKNNFMKKVSYVLDGRISDVETKTQGKPGWTQIDSIENYEKKVIRVSSKEMSDGMLRLLAFIAISELQRPQATMLLDEVENGINANYAEKLIRILSDMYTEKRHQLIMTTHSTVFLDYIQPENIIYLYRDGEGATRALKLFGTEEMKKQLEYMYPGEVVLNMSQSEILEKLLANE